MRREDTTREVLKPGRFDPSQTGKFRGAVALFCVAEAYILLWASGLLSVLGILPLFQGVAAVGAIGGCRTLGMNIETHLALLSGEPILNENDEIDSKALKYRASPYVYPPLVALFGAFGVLTGSVLVPIVTSTFSLLIFALIMRRIRAIWRAWRSSNA